MSMVRQYPPQKMTANTTTIQGASYGNGVYTSSASSTHGSWQAWKAVNAYDESEGGCKVNGDLET